MTTPNLLPCPFCGAGKTQFREQKHWTGMASVVLSVSVCHWCETVEGQPSRVIERVGKDKDSAIAAWNRRSDAALKEANDRAERLERERDSAVEAADAYSKGVYSETMLKAAAIIAHDLHRKLKIEPDAALAALPADREPVPMEPTEEMIDAGHGVVVKRKGYRIGILTDIYQAMLLAAPSHPPENQG